jgi:hypothetical protein
MVASREKPNGNGHLAAGERLEFEVRKGMMFISGQVSPHAVICDAHSLQTTTVTLIGT